ncbi:hypothetical protein ACWD6N_28385 [Micromonospora sp. NPDC005163]
MALNLPAVLDETALLACLSVLTTNPAIPTTVPAPDTSLRPPRCNFAGYCIMCGLRGCQSSECISDFAQTVWMVCDQCNGYGADPESSLPCSCWGGLTEADDTPNVGACANPRDRDCACRACQSVNDIYIVAPDAQALAQALAGAALR